MFDLSSTLQTIQQKLQVQAPVQSTQPIQPVQAEQRGYSLIPSLVQPQSVRPYQLDAIEKIEGAWQNNKIALVNMATGTGKTTVLAELLRRNCDPRTGRALVIAHTQEIIGQLYDRIRQQYGGDLDQCFGVRFAPGIGVVMGAKDAQDARIVIATRQSLHASRLPELLKHGVFDHFIVDEGHHAAAGNTYYQIRDTLRKANPNVKIAGFTATPKRGDRLALAAFYDEIVFEFGIKEAIQAGYLVPPTRIKVRTDVDLSGIKKENGDYDKKDLISVLDASNWVSLAVNAWQKYGKGEQTIAFFPQVAMSRVFVQNLTAAGVSAAHIDAGTPKDERAVILQKYQRGEITVVSNMAVLTEGFDAPSTRVILWARPTQSETVLTQAIGRGLRLFPGKQDCLVVDLTPKDARVLTVGTLVGKMITCSKCKSETYKGFKNCPKCGHDLSEEKAKQEKQEALGLVIHNGKGEGVRLVDEVVSLFDSLSSAWHKDAQGAFFSCSLGFKAGALVIAPPSFADNAQRLQERIAAGRRLIGEVSANKHDPSIVDDLNKKLACLERELLRIDHYTLWFVSEPHEVTGLVTVEFIRANGDIASLMLESDQEVARRAVSWASKETRWRSDPVSEGQIRLLRALSIKGWSKSMTKGEAAALITHAQVVPALKNYIQSDRLAEPKAKAGR